MKGTLKKQDGKWVVLSEGKQLPLHPEDIKILNDYGDHFVPFEYGKEVEFKIIDEFQEPGLCIEWGIGKIAKLL